VAEFLGNLLHSARAFERQSYGAQVAAEDIMNRTGYFAIVVAALMATSSAIKATFYGTGRLAYMVAKSGERPTELERTFGGQHLEGTFITAALGLVIANFVPLEAIATMGRAGLLLLFMAINIASLCLARETGARAWISGLPALTAAAILQFWTPTI
jgi:hypothetical protein